MTVKTEEERSKRVQAAHKRAVKRTPVPQCTDTANGNRLARRYGADIRFVVEDKADGWHVWNGSYWEQDSLGTIIEAAKDTAMEILRDEVVEEREIAEKEQDPDKRKLLLAYAMALKSWATLSLNVPKLNAMVKSASTIAEIAISASQLDTNGYLLQCENGTLDLRTGKLRESRREDLITKSTHVTYDPDATCPKFEAFLSWAMCNRPALVEFVWLALGMSLTGDVSERLILFLHGGGKNGKSTLLSVFRDILGDYAIRVSSDILEAASFAKGGGAASPHIADLKGRRFMTTSEVEDGTQLAVALLKDLTGNETLRGRHLYKNSFEFYPEFTPWIGANYKPDAPADDQALWDRMRLVPFDARIEPADIDKHLGERLITEEASGILATAVRYCLQWQATGITEPAEVMEATEDYRQSMDWFPDYLDHIRELPDYAHTPSAIREDFTDWVRSQGYPKLTLRQFKAKMEGHGCRQEIDKAGKRYWYIPDKPRHKLDWARMAREAESHVFTDDDFVELEVCPNDEIWQDVEVEA